MKKQISSIAPGQTAKALILVYLTFSVPIVLLGVVVAFVRYGSVELSTVFSALLLNAIFALTYELAQFENLTHIFVATEDGLHDALFGARPSIEALVADDAGCIVG